MGARGPQPTPTKVLESRGSWRAKTREGEPSLAAAIPPCPGWLSKEAKAEWKRLSGSLKCMGVAEVDGALLAAYCEAWSELVDLSTEIQALVKQHGARGYAQADNFGYMDLKNSAVKRLLQIADRFGLSPAARTRIRVLDDGKPPTTPEQLGKARFFDNGN